MNERKMFLTKLLYKKITWWTKSLSIRLIITNIATKNYLIYQLDIIFLICFLIGHCFFSMIYDICMNLTLLKK